MPRNDTPLYSAPGVAQNIFENGGWVQVRAVGRQRGQTRAPLSARHQLFFLALGTTWILVFSTGRATTPCRYTSYLDYRTGYSAFGCFFFTKPDMDMFPSLAATNLVAPTFSFKVKFVASDRPIYPGTVSQGWSHPIITPSQDFLHEPSWVSLICRGMIVTNGLRPSLRYSGVLMFQMWGWLRNPSD